MASAKVQIIAPKRTMADKKINKNLTITNSCQLFKYIWHSSPSVVIRCARVSYPGSLRITSSSVHNRDERKIYQIVRIVIMNTTIYMFRSKRPVFVRTYRWINYHFSQLGLFEVSVHIIQTFINGLKYVRVTISLKAAWKNSINQGIEIHSKRWS